MGNLYRINPFYEWELDCFPKKLSIPSKLVEKGKSLEYLFHFVATPEDQILLSHAPYSEFLEYLHRILGKLPAIACKIGQEDQLIEWGRFHKKVKKENGDIQLEPDEEFILKAKKYNSKIWQWEKWIELGLEETIRKRIEEISDIEKYISKFGFPVLLKKEFGFSGTHSFVIHSFLELKNILPKINFTENKMFIESWKDRIGDFSFLFQKEKDFHFLTKTEMQLNKDGVYSASSLVSSSKEEIEFYLNFLENLFQRFSIQYTGPICVDGFYYLENQVKKIRKITEINFRYSMGRLLYEISTRRKDSSAKLEFQKNTNSLSLSELLRQLERDSENKVILLTPNQKTSSIGIYKSYMK